MESNCNGNIFLAVASPCERALKSNIFMATDNISILKIESQGEHLEGDHIRFINRCEAGVRNLFESVFQHFLLKEIE